MSMHIRPTASQAVAWSGTYPGSPGRFQLRVQRLPRDAVPVYDDDIDCVIGYQRIFGRVAYAFDLLGHTARLWSLQDDDAAVCAGEARLTVGELWQPGVRAMTRAGQWGCGALIGKDARATLRRRFAELSNASLLLAPAALQRMTSVEQFIPIHILRLAILTGRRACEDAAQEFSAVVTVDASEPPKDGFRMLTVRTDRAAAVIEDFQAQPVPAWMVGR